jgi:DNA-binding response OmpR family regulator
LLNTGLRRTGLEVMQLEAPVLCRALVVEDDPDSCEALRLQLQRWGCEVECATTAGAALVRVDEWQPHCVLLDLMLPDAAGGVVLRKIRANKMPIHVAVITAAGETSPVLRSARTYSPDAIFQKPLNFEDIRRWILGCTSGGQGGGGSGGAFYPFTAPI